MTQRLKKLYLEKVRDELQTQFEYKNKHEIPFLEKIVLNRGFSALTSQSDQKKTGSSQDGGLQASFDELNILTAQKPVITLAKKSIAGFKVREKMPVGVCVTLRGEKMYAFLDRLINLALPRQRDFQGLKNESFDGYGNYTLGLEEQLLFPEIDYDKIDRLRGMDISIVTTAKTNKEGFSLLQKLGMPFRTL
uniref:Large ribosomal subunit protein uL5c n=1 Tax=Microrhizoidea pickettheapsiorum TaxID=2604950 RepID=A0A5B9RTQ9_9CHLO|nr:ribosomal protein L5 [Microrhizoidea pickettheapsiorum]QEG77695.1 ribosomal protein L5 [Microrhizoidea pickettheapsiorum]